MRRRSFLLDTVPSQQVATIELVPGPNPYLWIGEKKGACFGTLDVAGMVRLRDAIDRCIEAGGQGG